ncbi:hypothetical protein FEDK69T_26070 [Flavobacterium enshiense DK69]|nr:hypothetical protein FEDK69T_26070 [Flavobacterium enshiense DK69]
MTVATVGSDDNHAFVAAGAADPVNLITEPLHTDKAPEIVGN